MMQKRNYTDLISRVKQRTNPDGFSHKRMMSEGLSIPYSDVIEYVKLSMYGVPAQYTINSKESANKVIAHLKRSHGSEVDFKLQGSIETNTHILKDNDVDLVQISNKSNTVDRVGLNEALQNPYKFNNTEYANLKRHSDEFSLYDGKQLSDLGVLRNKAETVLLNNYNEVDISKPKAIFVKTSSPKRKVDVVTAVFYKNVSFMKSNQDFKKGIQIYDKDNDVKLPVEFPFWSIKRINEKSIATNGRIKKMIRFLKNLKFDSNLLKEKSKISSFDINSYRTLSFIDLISILYLQISKIISDTNYRDNLKSVDGQETIFENEPQKLRELIYLKSEIDSILGDINFETNRAI
jgi:hypothetical protein